MPEKPFTLLRRPLAVWLAVLVALFGAFASTLSQARGGASAGIEICTDTGPRWVAPGPAQKTVPQPAGSNPIAADSPEGQESALALAHCQFCLPTTDRAAPASRSFTFLVVAPGDPEEPTIWQAFFFFSKDTTAAAQPRGPPDTPASVAAA